MLPANVGNYFPQKALRIMFKNMHYLNVLFAVGYAVLAASAGSAITALLITSIIGGMLLAVLSKARFDQLMPTDWLFVGPCLAYFIVMGASLIHPDFEVSDFKALLQPALFGLVIFAVLRYRSVKGGDYFKVFLHYAPYCGILLIPWIAYHLLFLDGRMAAGAGNAIPFAMICAIFIPLSLMSMRGARGYHKIICAIAVGSMIVALLLSQTRSMYLALLINFGIMFLYFLIESKHRRNVAIFGALMFILAVGVVGSSDSLMMRGKSLMDAAQSVISSSEVADRSVRQRLALYDRAWCLLKQKPIQGYGIGNRDELMQGGRPSRLVKGAVECPMRHRTFTHYHNGFLTAGIDAGIAGILSALILLVSPLVLAAAAPKDQYRRKRFVFAVVIVTTYSISAMTNLLFGNDLVDGLFLVCGLFLALSVVKTNEPALEDVSNQPTDLRSNLKALIKFR